MDNINIIRSKSSRKINQNKIPKYNEGKRKSDGLAGNLFLNKFKGSHNNKVNKIPINHRMSIQDANMFTFSKLISNIKPDNNEKPKKKDKDYYLKLLNKIYSNDSHLSNNNVIKNNTKKKEGNINKKFERKISMNTPQIMNNKNDIKFIRKDSKKRPSILSQKQKCEPNNNNNNNELDNCIKDDKSTKKENNTSNEAKESKSTKRLLSQKTVSKFNAKKGLKIKKKENKNSKKQEKVINDELKEEKILENNKEIKKNENINHLNNKKESKNNDKEETELYIDNIKNPPKNKILKNKSNKKHCESCFLCCFTVKDDSFIN